MHMFGRSAFAFGILLSVLISGVTAQETTSPREALGFDIGDDYHLATYTQFEAYWRTLADESPRMVLREIGSTAEGRAQLMAIITSPDNQAELERYREIARRLALAEGVSEAEARALAAEGKAVVWIDGGLHATETLGAHQLMETVYQLVSRHDEETVRFLDDVIVLAVHANPDGMELVSNWYMREPVPTRRSTSKLPRLYHKYIGHDNNRDFFMVSQPETENMTRVMFREWFPQIVYNHHQRGPAGTVMFAPPFRAPFNYNFDPLIPVGIDGVGAAMHARFVEEGKGGTTMRGGASYSTWWNGGLRTTVYFHNMIGLLTETIGDPTPITVPLVPDRQLPGNDLPAPIEPQPWHFRQSIDYSVTANRAVLDYASRHREELLFRIWRMGQNSIERGSRDHWTMHPARIDAIKDAIRADGLSVPTGRRTSGVDPRYLHAVRTPEHRDPRAYVLPSDQPDFPTATKFVNALIKNGITVHRASAPFEAGTHQYPAGSYVVQTAQAFRPHVMDMFEPQDHPNDFEYDGGPPIAPYDNAGWTLALQMGVEFDRLLDAVTGPFEALADTVAPPPGSVTNGVAADGFLLSHAYNDAARVTNRLVDAGHQVYWLNADTEVDGTVWPAGTIYIPNAQGTTDAVRGMARDLGVSFTGASQPSGVTLLAIEPVRIALWDRYGGAMSSGWTRWLLERFEFTFDVVYPDDLNAGSLHDRYDVILLPDSAIGASRDDDPPLDVPAEYRARLGRISEARTVPELHAFLEAGGTIVALESSVALASQLGLGIDDHLVDENDDALSDDVYYMPGSIHRVWLEDAPVTWGMGDAVDVFFNNSPVFRLREPGFRRLAWFDDAPSLRSGWAWGGQHLEGGVTMAEGEVGSGKLYLFGPGLLNRGQTHGTFKLVFNAIHLARAREVAPSPSTEDDGM